MTSFYPDLKFCQGKALLVQEDRRSIGQEVTLLQCYRYLTGGLEAVLVADIASTSPVQILI